MSQSFVKLIGISSALSVTLQGCAHVRTQSPSAFEWDERRTQSAPCYRDERPCPNAFDRRSSGLGAALENILGMLWFWQSLKYQPYYSTPQ